jgi:uncharacterized protein (TIGR02145 family)
MKTKIYFFALTLTSILELHAQTTMNIHQSNGTVLQIPLNTIDSITYTISNLSNLATITTTAVTSITGTTAVSGGDISNNGGTNITARGIVWSWDSNPTLSNNLGSTSDGTGAGTFTSNLTGLIDTTYYVRAYAINSAGTAYGNMVSFTTSTGVVTNPGTGVTFDGYIYSSIVLGNGQEWMVENLRTTSYANGDPIPNITDGTQWANLTTGAWKYYFNDNQYENPYGKLYNWHTVNDSRNVCPTGWHVPSDAEWSVLSDYLGGQNVAGGKMKSTGTQYWQSPNTDATNVSGFSGLPGGGYSGSGAFDVLGSDGVWWCSSELDSDYAWIRYLSHLSGDVGSTYYYKTDGFSVRCLKD